MTTATMAKAPATNDTGSGSTGSGHRVLPYITLEGAAALMGVSLSRLRQLIDAGEDFGIVHFSRRKVLIERSVFEVWLAEYDARAARARKQAEKARAAEAAEIVG
jgi:excisionase family DNA binding protein